MYGYYFFLGRGDWGTSREKTLDPTFRGNVKTAILGYWGLHRTGTELTDAPEWSSSWNASTWKEHIDFLVDTLKADSMFFCMNGYELPYASTSFPEAVEIDHCNVSNDFFQEVFDYAKTRGLYLGAVFCTTGHALGYVRAHPDYSTVAKDGTRHRENLCHNHPEGRRYAETVVCEMLTRYHGFDALSFHPPENVEPCYCEYCREKFLQATGKCFAVATDKEIQDFYWRSCLGFQQEMEALGKSFIPDAKLFCVSIPGRFEDDFEIIGRAIPRETTIMHWDYWSFDEKIADLLEDLKIYRSLDHQVTFVCSSGWSLDKCGRNYGERVVEQIRAVKKDGIDDLIYFVGAIWHEESLRRTSLVLNS